MIRIVSYNLHSGRDLFWRKRLNRMADTLKAIQADVICLQEVQQNSKFGFQADYLSDQLQCEMCFAPTLALADGSYGIALLTRLPILRTHVYSLPARREQRALLEVSLDWKGTPILVGNTHCSLSAKSRLAQFQALLSWAQRRKNSPLFLAGDFNSPSASFAPLLTDCGRAMGQQEMHTMPAFRRRLDYIFASGHWEVRNYSLAYVHWSDHLPVIAELALRESPVPPG
jgi:endonuclease/exonuclease/phosphatase family metal-dependent hydrolase